MPLSGTLTRRAHFKRSTAGSMGRFNGTVGKAFFKAVAGALRFSATLTRKVMFKRTVAGSIHMTGIGSRTAAYFRRTISGSIHFSSAVSRLAGVSKAAYGYLTMTATLAHKVMFKRAVSGTLHMTAAVSKSIPWRARTVAGNLYFRGWTTIAAGGSTMKRGLGRLGFRFKGD